MTFRHPIAIAAADIDHMGHVNNAVYLRWVQDAVVHYWEAVAPAEAVARHLWVALKHEISYLRPAFLGDGLAAHVRQHAPTVLHSNGFKVHVLGALPAGCWS